MFVIYHLYHFCPAIKELDCHHADRLHHGPYLTHLPAAVVIVGLESLLIMTSLTAWLQQITLLLHWHLELALY